MASRRFSLRDVVADAREIAADARERATDATERFREAAADAGETLRERAHDATGGGVDPELAAKLRRIAVMAAPFAPAEILLSAGAIAAVIKIADEKGLLESPAAAPLKALAAEINGVAPLDENRLFAAVPQLFESGIMRRVMGDSAASRRIAQVAKVASTSQTVRRAVQRMRGDGGHEVG